MAYEHDTQPAGLFEILGAARRYRAGGVGPKATLLVILERAGQHDETGAWTCWPSLATMAAETEQTPGTIRRHIAKFVADGLLTREIRGASDGKGRRSSLLTVNVAELGLNAHHARSVSGTQRASEGVPNAHTEGVAPYIEHQEEVQEPAPNGAREDSTLGLTSQGLEPRDRFDEFWNLYPRKAAKGHARAAWSAAIRKASVDAIIREAAAYGVSRAGQDPKFTKHAATWLRGECWEDNLAQLAEPEPEESFFDRQARREWELAQARRTS